MIGKEGKRVGRSWVGLDEGEEGCGAVDFGVFVLKVGEGEGVYLFGGAKCAVVVVAAEGVGGVGDDGRAEAEVARHAGGRFDRVVGDDPDEDQLCDLAGVEHFG